MTAASRCPAVSVTPMEARPQVSGHKGPGCRPCHRCAHPSPLWPPRGRAPSLQATCGPFSDRSKMSLHLTRTVVSQVSCPQPAATSFTFESVTHCFLVRSHRCTCNTSFRGDRHVVGEAGGEREHRAQALSWTPRPTSCAAPVRPAAGLAPVLILTYWALVLACLLLARSLFWSSPGLPSFWASEPLRQLSWLHPQHNLFLLLKCSWACCEV